MKLRYDCGCPASDLFLLRLHVTFFEWLVLANVKPWTRLPSWNLLLLQTPLPCLLFLLDLALLFLRQWLNSCTEKGMRGRLCFLFIQAWFKIYKACPRPWQARIALTLILNEIFSTALHCLKLLLNATLYTPSL